MTYPEVRMEKLKRLREERGLSQVKLAARADLNPATVNQIERGMRDASPGTLRKLADALEISLYDLLEDEVPKVQAPLPLEGADAGLVWALAAPDEEFDAWVGTATQHEVLVLNYELSEAAAREATDTEAYRLMFERLMKVIDRLYVHAGGLGLIQEPESSRRRRARVEQEDAEDAESEAG